MLAYWIIFAGFALAAISYHDRRGQAAQHDGLRTRPTRPAASIGPELAAVALIVFIGLRYHVGGDWNNYDITFRVIAHQSFGEIFNTSSTEIGYATLNWVASELGTGIWLVNLICAVPFSWGLMRLCKLQPNPWLSFVVATPFLIIVVGMGFTRQAVALGFLMMGLASFIRDRRLGRFIFYCLCGALFHRTVLIFIPIILLVTGRSKIVSVFLAGLAGLIAYYTVFSSAMEQYWAGYVKADYDSAGALIRVLMNVAPSLLLLISGDRLYRSIEEKVVWRTFALLALIVAAALSVVSSSVIVDRLGMYLIPIQFFVLGRIQFIFSQDARPSTFWGSMVIIYSGVVLFVWLNYGHFSGGWVPYRSFLSAI